MAKAHLPPVPPANQAKVPGTDRVDAKDARNASTERDEALQQGQSGNLKQNTTHQGFQQDR
ncbi:hypothetical protein IBL26_11685 [Roseomonas aerophila]|uniref:Uncharacterized protein n=1 Tax=Teichococcus aerophilus TaxID=1224513 RepID=A0ABR7RLR6_9PROT|nr:hypothetical protein [Pseudoroseomonas aerophila]MBC9207497.1 hypothetical protein [Pseudoroseomonas aerophila]